MGISFVKNCGIIKLSVKKANCIDNTGVKGCNAMKEITKETLLKAMKSRDAGEHPIFRECEFKDMDLSGMDLHNMDFTLSSFQNVKLQCGKCIIRRQFPAWCKFSECKYEDGSIPWM